MNALKAGLRVFFLWLERIFDTAFGPKLNPLNHLGGLGFLFFWIVLVTGIYLYIAFETSVHGVYASIEYLTHEQWYLGGVMRSLHRYGSDAMVAMMMVHILREFSMDRLRGPRWFTWFTGVPVLWLVYASGVTGYWLVWDTLAQYVAIATSEWLDVLGISSSPFARNFISPDALDDRFFTLLIFIHIAVPLILLFVLWVHLQRVSRPEYGPPKVLAISTTAVLTLLSLVFPAVSHPPADMAKVPADLQLDWFYLALYPLFDSWGYMSVWALSVGASTLICLLPWLPPLKKKERISAFVSLDHCNGCGHCADDCPYMAIRMQPRTDGKPYQLEAKVDSDKCVACGLCVGACPMSVPYRTTVELPTGIDMPDPSLRDLRDRAKAASARAGAAGKRIMVFGCVNAVSPAKIEGPGIVALDLPCIGMLPPTFIDWVLSRRLAEGVFVTGCRESGCTSRFGVEWTDDRIDGKRDPRLRSRVPRERLGRLWAGKTEARTLATEIRAFQARIAALQPTEKPAARSAAS